MAVADVNVVSFGTGDLLEVRNNSGTFSITDGSGSLLDSAFILRSNPIGSAIGWVQIAGRGATDAEKKPFSLNVAYYRFYFLYEVKPASGEEDIARLVGDNDTTTKCNIRLTSTGTIKAIGSLGTIGETSATLSQSTVYRIEVEAGTGAGGAPFNLHIYVGDSTTPLDSISASTGLSGASNGSLILGKVGNNSSQSVDYYYAHVAISSAGFIGPGRARLVAPSADGTYTNATIGAGSGQKWEQVDDIPNDDDTTYLLTSAVVDNAYTAVCDVQSVIPVGASVNAVKAFYKAKREVLNASTLFRFRSGSTNADSSTIIQTQTAYRVFEQLFTIDPNTGMAWDRANMSALEGGLIDKSNRQSRITGIYMTVDYTVAGATGGGGPNLNQVIVIG